MTDYQFEYLKVLEEEGITEIPKEVSAKIRYAKMVLAKYKSKPSDAMYKSLTKADDAVVESIESYLESKSHNTVPEAEKATEKVEAPPAPTPAPIEAPKQEPPPPPDKEALVRAALTNGRIHADNLKAIIGKLDGWSGSEKIGSLKLEKVMFSDDYKEV